MEWKKTYLTQENKVDSQVKTKTNIPRSLKARTKHCICFAKGQNGEEKKTFGATSEANFAVNGTIKLPPSNGLAWELLDGVAQNSSPADNTE